MDDLNGDRATWRFDGETVAIRYRAGRFANPVLQALGRCEVPVAAVAAVDFDLFSGRKRRWALHLRLRERTDPYAAAGAMLAEKAQPFRLVGPASTELVAEYLADQIRFAAGQAAETAALPPDLATRLVPPLPFHIQTAEGAATLDRSAVRLLWTGWAAASRKRKAHRREIALAHITGAEWVPSDGWDYGHLRLLTTKAARTRVTRPKHDLACLLSNAGKEDAHALLMAAAITAHVWAGPRPELT
ncbi:DUF4429 domain-containing protein [Streptomonospora sp. S1-112]|uniref:DUF4429 domain-containing protein n=1 Tax=Streptomonospora mangrovi TaxID=2883123 RepID=A0A9X3NL29_9ACTN|nr:DUF4429 domain-containing protein [Streptomonospora mangrovi]MDA0565714.1 DUF4429 domain-containing protein [Streptomonospora mangrovi]